VTGFSLSRETRRLVIDQPFFLDAQEGSDPSLPRLEIAYRTWGTLVASSGPDQAYRTAIA